MNTPAVPTSCRAEKSRSLETDAEVGPRVILFLFTGSKTGFCNTFFFCVSTLKSTLSLVKAACKDIFSQTFKF